MFLLEMYDILLYMKGASIDLYNKFYETVKSSTEHNVIVNPIWGQQDIRGINPTTFAIDSTNNIILNLIYKYEYSGGPVAMNLKSVKTNIKYQVVENKYEYTENSYAVSKCDYEKQLESASTQNKSRLAAMTRKNLIDNKYQRQYTKTEAWKEFCSNGKLKLLKDIKGNKWICQIQSAPTRTVNGASNYLMTTITFEWREALDASTSKVISIS